MTDGVTRSRGYDARVALVVSLDVARSYEHLMGISGRRRKDFEAAAPAAAPVAV